MALRKVNELCPTIGVIAWQAGLISSPSTCSSRYPNDLLVRPIELFRTVVRDVRATWPFHIDAWVVLPDQLHCGWILPPDDDDFTNRGRLIKQRFSKGLSNGERRSSVRIARGERGIWQGGERG